MEPPDNRKSLTSFQAQCPNETVNALLKTKALLSALNHPCLTKNIWVEILDYIDTKSYLTIIPQLDSFFYTLINEFKSLRKTLDFKLNIEFSNTENENDYRITNDSKCIKYILNCSELNKLELNLSKFGISSYDKLKPRLNHADYFYQLPL